MDQNEFQRAIQKHQKRKLRLQAQSVAEDPVRKAPSALPFLETKTPKPKDPKPQVEKPKYKPMEVLITGPVEMTFRIEYSGTLMGSQLTKSALEPLFKKALSVAGRVT